MQRVCQMMEQRRGQYRK